MASEKPVARGPRTVQNEKKWYEGKEGKERRFRDSHCVICSVTRDSLLDAHRCDEPTLTTNRSSLTLAETLDGGMEEVKNCV